MNTVGAEGRALGVPTKHGGTMRSSSAVGEGGGGFYRRSKHKNNSAKVPAVDPSKYARAISSSRLEVAASGAMFSHMIEEEVQRGDRLTNKSMVWREPMLLLQRIGSRRVPAFCNGKATRSSREEQPTRALLQNQQQEYAKKPSQWVRFWRKFRFDSGKKIHAAKAEWLNYDAQSYAMNFEKDRFSPYHSNFQQMPKISGPQAREIVTVLLKRSPSANRNSGAILIPKPVLAKQESHLPLWKRRGVQAPSPLEIKGRAQSLRRRSTGSAA